MYLNLSAAQALDPQGPDFVGYLKLNTSGRNQGTYGKSGEGLGRTAFASKRRGAPPPRKAHGEDIGQERWANGVRSRGW